MTSLNFRALATMVTTGLLLLATTFSANAAIYIPGEAVPGVDGEVFGWNRGDFASTFSGWDVFEGLLPPGSGGAAVTDSTPDMAGQFGTPGSVTIGAGTIPVGSGNAYSPFAALQFSSLINSGAQGGPNTRIVAQFRVGGSELDYDNILLSTDPLAAGSIAPNLLIETGRLALGGFGGDQVDTLALWDLDFSQATFRLDFGAAESSLSLQQFTVDTFTSASALVTPTVTAVPEPAGPLALAMLTAIAAAIRRPRSASAC